MSDSESLVSIYFVNYSKVWEKNLMYAHIARERLAEKLMPNVITNQYIMKWPSFSTKKPDGYQIRKKKANPHLHHHFHLPFIIPQNDHNR